jgi:hypothetical protein
LESGKEGNESLHFHWIQISGVKLDVHFWPFGIVKSGCRVHCT